MKELNAEERERHIRTYKDIKTERERIRAPKYLAWYLHPPQTCSKCPILISFTVTTAFSACDVIDNDN